MSQQIIQDQETLRTETYVDNSQTNRFSLEYVPAFLEPYFVRVETHILESALRFPTAQSFVDDVDSAHALIVQLGSTDEEWREILDFVQAEMEAVIAREGRFDVTKITRAAVGVKGV